MSRSQVFAVDDGLTPRQRLAVDLLARGHKVRHVARQLNVTEQTIHYYKKHPAVIAAITRAQEEISFQGGSIGISNLPEVAEILVEIASNKNARDSDRISACRVLLNSADAFAQRRLMERRLVEVEALLRDLSGVDDIIDQVRSEDMPPLDDTAFLLSANATSPEGDLAE